MGNLTKQGSKYSDEDRRRVVLEYSITGSISKVAKSTGIPRRTLNDWKKTDWWDDVAATVRHEKEAKILADNERIMDLAQREIEDRLENGDVQLVRTKDGVQEHRVPVKAKDVSIIKGIADDKRRLSLNQPTSIKGDTQSIEQLAEYFEKISQEHRFRQVNSIPGECKERSPNNDLDLDDSDD